MFRWKVLLLAVALAGIVFGQQAQGPKPDDVVAEVNGIKITVGDVIAELNHLSPEVQQQILQDPNGKTQLLNSVIKKKLLVAEAKKLGIDTLDFVQKAVERAANDIYVQVLLNEVQRQNAQVTEEEARQFYEKNDSLFNFDYRYHIQQLVFADKELAEKVLKQLRKGKITWEEAVKKYPGVGNTRSGDAGWYFKNNLVPAARDAVATLKDGEISDVVPIGSLFYILKLVEHEEPRKATFDEVKTNIIQYLSSQKAQQAVANYQNRLWMQAKISIDNAVLNSINLTPQR
ncbi:peptidyl-prolyl cis-trans isomerase [bacterium]|nr:peptidyl-prolyl cis-trans isomerase [bacterium]